MKIFIENEYLTKELKIEKIMFKRISKIYISTDQRQIMKTLICLAWKKVLNISSKTVNKTREKNSFDHFQKNI